MKNLRKIAILTIIFVLSAVLNVYAADYATNELIQITLKPTSTQVKPGDTISIVVAGKTQSELEGISAILKYDSTKLQFTGHTIHEYYIDLTGKDEQTKEINLFTMYGSLTAPETAPSEADLLTLNFKVLDAAVEGETLSVKLSTVSAGDFMYEDWVDLSDKEVTLTVVGEGAQTPGDGEQNPDDGEQNPDQGEQTPDGGEQNPDQGEQTPDGGEQNPDQGEQTPDGGEQNPDQGEQTPDGGEQNPDQGEQTPDGGEQNPDQGEQTPDGGEQNPDQGEQTPDNGEQNPDQGEQKPDNGEQNPDQGEQKPSDGEQNSNKNEKPKDETIADKPINNAGLETFGFAIMVTIVVIAIVLYAKCKKYSDVK